MTDAWANALAADINRVRDAEAPEVGTAPWCASRVRELHRQGETDIHIAATLAITVGRVRELLRGMA